MKPVTIRHIIPLIFIFMILSGVTTALGPSADAADYIDDGHASRKDLIGQALDQADKTLNKDDVPDEFIFSVKMPPLSQDTTAARDRTSQPPPALPRRPVRAAPAPAPESMLRLRKPLPEPPPSATPLVKPRRPEDAYSDRHPLTAFDVGVELMPFHYEQEKHWPDFNYYGLYWYLAPLQISHDGLLYGAFASYTHRLQHNQPVTSFRDLFENGNTANFFKVDARYVTGEVDYDVSVQDEIDGYGASEYELRGVVGYDFPTHDYGMIYTPYFGFGYRALHIEDAGGWLDYRGDFYNYDKDMYYGYLPIGLQVRKDFQQKWALELSLEYDWIVFGNMTKHFDQIGYIFPGTGDALGKMLKHEKTDLRQNEGYGLKAQAKIIKRHEPFDLFVEPFIRYWKINASDPAHYLLVDEQDNQYIGMNGSGSYKPVTYEPDNTTVEYGLRMGLRY